MSNKFHRCTAPGCRKLTADDVCDLHREQPIAIQENNDLKREQANNALNARLRAGLALADQYFLDLERDQERVKSRREELDGLRRAAHRVDTCMDQPVFSEGI